MTVRDVREEMSTARRNRKTDIRGFLTRISPLSIDRKSIGGKLFLLVYGTVVILSVSLGILAYSMARNIVIESVAGHERRFIEEVSNLLDEQIALVRNQVEILAFDKGLNDLLKQDLLDSLDLRKYAVDEQIKRLIYMTNARKEAILSLIVLDRQEGMLAYFDESVVTHRLSSEQLLRESDWYEYLQQTPDRWLWLGFDTQDIFETGFRDQKYLSMVHTIMDLSVYPNYKMVGMIHVVLNSNNLLNKARSVLGQENKSLEVVDKRGQILLSFDEDAIGSLYAGPLEPDLQQEGSFSIVKDKEGKRSLEIRYYDQRYRWHYIERISLDFLGGTLEPTVFLIVSIVLAVLLVTYIVIRLEVIRFLDPLRQLKETMGQIGQGNVAKRFEYSGDDEVGVLGKSFNVMMAKLSAAERQKRRKEFEVLQAQINPHFLYNTLNTIKMMAIDEGQPQIRYAVSSLIHLFRNTIGKGSRFATVNEEIEAVKHYVNLMQLRYGQIFTVSYQVAPEVAGCHILRFLLQPIVENAIFHGVANLTDRQGEISIIASIEDGELSLRVEDTGNGIPQQRLSTLLSESSEELEDKEAGNIGMRNVHERIRLYHGERFGLEIDSKEHVGTKVTIWLPLFYERAQISRWLAEEYER